MKHLLKSLTVMSLVFAGTGFGAESYVCPAPNEVRCVPAQTSLGGWTHNGGQMTGNTFAPNNQCANVIKLPNSQSRLMCCYTKCGVFYQDVDSTRCKKTSERHFLCEM